MDFHALSRRELQALCKRNAVRANMSNAAMADALRSLPSVDGLDEIGRTAPPPISAMKSVEEVIVEEEKTDGRPPPGRGRARSKARTAAADKMEQDVRDQATLPGSEGTAAWEAVAPVEVEEVTGEKQGPGCPLPRGGRTRAKTRKGAAHKTENQGTAAEGMEPVEAEKVATGKGRTRRSTRSKVKIALDQEEEVAVAVQEEKADTSDAAFGSVLVVSDKSCNDPKEDEVVAVVEEEATKPEEGQNAIRRPAAHEAEEEVPVPAILRRSQRTVAPVGMAPAEVEEVATGKRRTRRSVRSRVKMASNQTEVEGATVQKVPKDSSDVAIGSAVVSDKSCDDPKMHEVVVVVEEVTKGQNVTRRPAAHEMEDVPAPGMLRRSQRTAAPAEAEEVATAKKRTRRSTRSKVAGAAQKGQKADSSDTTIGSADKRSDSLKEDEVVAVVEEESTKPHDGGSATRRATAHKMEEAAVPVEAEEGATTKRRRPRRYKVAAAAQNEHKVDSSDAAIGSTVLVSDQNSDDRREGDLVAVKEHVTKPQEGIVEEQVQSSIFHKSASSGKMEDPPAVSIMSKPEAADVPDKAAAAADETVKKDCFTLTAKVDQSDLLVNMLDKFSKPMYEFTVKEEKKESECWWALM